MNYVNVIVGLLGSYAALVLLAEALIWRFQPTMDGGVTLIVDPRGERPITRNLYGFDRDGTLFVASNHWFRSWYHAAIERPDVDVTVGGETGRYSATPVTGEDQARLTEEYSLGFVLRLLCGFAPSRFLRLTPQR